MTINQSKDNLIEDDLPTTVPRCRLRLSTDQDCCAFVEYIRMLISASEGKDHELEVVLTSLVHSGTFEFIGYDPSILEKSRAIGNGPVF
jgi:hypothetical protein